MNICANLYGQTALVYAILRNDKDMVVMLIDAGVKSSVKDRLEDAALSIAKNSDYEEIVELLQPSIKKSFCLIH